MTPKKYNMKPSKKLFEVKVKFINEDGWEVDSRTEKVIAHTADEAINRVKIRTNKVDGNEFFSGVELISEIDKL